MNLSTIHIRNASEDDFPFVEQMCYEAGYPDYLTERPSFENARLEKWFQDYMRNWPHHKGDFGVIAEDATGEPVGAAWYRDYVRSDLPKDIPTHELSIALLPRARGIGLGRKLMRSLIKGATKRGVDTL